MLQSVTAERYMKKHPVVFRLPDVFCNGIEEVSSDSFLSFLYVFPDDSFAKGSESQTGEDTD